MIKPHPDELQNAHIARDALLAFEMAEARGDEALLAWVKNWGRPLCLAHLENRESKEMARWPD